MAISYPTILVDFHFGHFNRHDWCLSTWICHKESWNNLFLRHSHPILLHCLRLSLHSNTFIIWRISIRKTHWLIMIQFLFFHHHHSSWIFIQCPLLNLEQKWNQYIVLLQRINNDEKRNGIFILLFFFHFVFSFWKWNFWNEIFFEMKKKWI